MSKYSEGDAAEAILDAADRKSFIPLLFGNALKGGGSLRVNSAMSAFMGFIDALNIDYDHNNMTDANRNAMILAKHIKNMILEEYGEFPPTLE